MILTKRSEDPSYNVATNTLSFAKKYQKSAPKHRVRNQYKKSSDMPQPGYYDTAECYDKTFGKKLINAVRMDQDLPRGEGLFAKKAERENWKSLEKLGVENKWAGDQIPQAYMDFKGQMSRKE